MKAPDIFRGVGVWQGGEGRALLRERLQQLELLELSD